MRFFPTAAKTPLRLKNNVRWMATRGGGPKTVVARHKIQPTLPTTLGTAASLPFSRQCSKGAGPALCGLLCSSFKPVYPVASLWLPIVGKCLHESERERERDCRKEGEQHDDVRKFHHDDNNEDDESENDNDVDFEAVAVLFASFRRVNHHIGKQP